MALLAMTASELVYGRRPVWETLRAGKRGLHKLWMVSGMAGGVISPEQAQREDEARVDAGEQVVAATVEQLGLTGAEPVVLRGDPGSALCDLAGSLPASVVVLGTRGRGGLRRAVLGSVSDFVVRNAPCPVVVTTGRG